MIDQSFPAAMHYFRAAAMHLEASKTLLRECPKPSWSKMAHEVIYLSGYVVECVLKAAILSRTPPKKHEELVRRFKEKVKHNLETLHQLLVEKGVEVPPVQVRLLRNVKSEWNPEMRYYPGSRSADDAGFVQNSAAGVYRWAERG